MPPPRVWERQKYPGANRVNPINPGVYFEANIPGGGIKCPPLHNSSIVHDTVTTFGTLKLLLILNKFTS